MAQIIKGRFRHPLFFLLLVVAAGVSVIVFSLSRGSGILPAEVNARATAVTENFVDPSEPDPDPKRPNINVARIDARAQLLMADPKMAGLALAVVDNGQVTFMRGYGVADRATGEAVTTDTVFRWASLSKGVAATLSYQLAEQGSLSLAQSLDTYQTNLRLPQNAQATLNLTDLLAHRVGVTHNALDGKLENGADPVSLRRSLISVPLQCPPGQCYSYQNIAYDATSEVITNATGRTLQAQANAQLFAPLGMTSTGYGMANLTGAKSWARPYRRDRLMELVPSYFLVPAAAGVSSNIKDLARWMQAQMGGDPDIISPAVLHDIHRPRVATKTGQGTRPIDILTAGHSYGQGWRAFSYAGNGLVHHGGAVNGYRAAIMFDPAKKSGIVMLWNSSETRPYKLQYEFLDLLYQRPYFDWLELDDLADNAAS